MIKKIDDAVIGDHVVFGKYYQSNSETKEEIEWRVLAKEGTKLLLISEYAVDCQPYNTEYAEDVTWENCTLRKWLNEVFIKEAFSADEQQMISETKVTAEANPCFKTNPGNDTIDKVFLLSIAEADKYFSSDVDRMCDPTEYANAEPWIISENDEDSENDEESCWWWLRSPGDGSDQAACVYWDGDIYGSGDDVNSSYNCVRPALWIEI